MREGTMVPPVHPLIYLRHIRSQYSQNVQCYHEFKLGLDKISVTQMCIFSQFTSHSMYTVRVLN